MIEEKTCLTERLSTLRRTMQYGEALRLISTIKDTDGADQGFMQEIIRILILAGQTKVALKFVDLYGRMEGTDKFLDEEIILRLSMFAGELDISIISSTPTGFDWVKVFRERGADEIFKPRVKGCKVINRGYTHYTFSLECSSCRTTYPVEIRGTLLVEKEYLCPICLAKTLFSFKDIITFVSQEHPELLGEGVEKYTTKEGSLLVFLNRSTCDDSVPLLARAMNQDTVFALNQLVANELFSKA